MVKSFLTRIQRHVSVCILRNKFNFEKISSVSLFVFGFLVLLYGLQGSYNVNHLFTWVIWLIGISCYHMYIVFSSKSSLVKRTILNFAAGMIWFYNSLLLFFFDINFSNALFWSIFVIQLTFSLISFFIFSILILSSKIKIRSKENGNGFNRNY